MRFRINWSTGKVPNGTLVYRPAEYSFDIDPRPDGCFTSILLDDLSLEVDRASRVIAVWGVCPHTRWQAAVLTSPSAAFGELLFVPDAPLSRGVAVPLNERYLPVLVDRASGWVCVQKPAAAAAAAVKVLNGVVVELTEQGQLCALWLKPERLYV